MSNRLTQIALDFGPEHAAPAPPSGVETGSASQPPLRQYIEAAGVVVRFKSYKKTPSPQPHTNTAQPEKLAAPSLSKLPVPEADNQLPMFVNGDLFAMDSPETMSPELKSSAMTIPESESSAMTIPEPESSPTPIPESESSPMTSPDSPVADTVTVAPVPRAAQRRAAAPKPATPKTPSKRGRKSLKEVAAEAELIEVPADEVLFSKQYYTMGQVSEMFHVNQSLLRFWETEFDILQPRKNKKGDRYFRPVDIKNLHLIYHLLRQKKYTIEGAREFLKKNKKADERFEVIQRLQEIRTFLLEWKAQL